MDPGTLRHLANGSETVISVAPDALPSLWCCPFNLTEEPEAIRFTTSVGGILIQRGPDGVVKIFASDYILVSEQRQWSTRPYAPSVIPFVRRSAPQVSTATLARILSYCFHTLSNCHIGATLVWRLDDSVSIGATGGGTTISALALNINESLHRGAITSLLAQHDGAIILSEEGQIIDFGVHLKPSPMAERLIKPAPGTRHTSASRFSFDEPSTLVFVVSQDGPVSVFSDGVRLTELRARTASELGQTLSRMVPDKAGDMWSEDIGLVQCRCCSKWSNVEVLVIAGWKDEETCRCPACGSPIASARCFHITATIQKKLSNT